jgi:hypothetical protein
MELAADTSKKALPSRVRSPRRHRATKPQLLTRDQLDGRTGAAKLFDRLVVDIENDLGGREQLSTIERTLVEAHAACPQRAVGTRRTNRFQPTCSSSHRHGARGITTWSAAAAARPSSMAVPAQFQGRLRSRLQLTASAVRALDSACGALRLSAAL